MFLYWNFPLRHFGSQRFPQIYLGIEFRISCSLHGNASTSRAGMGPRYYLGEWNFIYDSMEAQNIGAPCSPRPGAARFPELAESPLTPPLYGMFYSLVGPQGVLGGGGLVILTFPLLPILPGGDRWRGGAASSIHWYLLGGGMGSRGDSMGDLSPSSPYRYSYLYTSSRKAEGVYHAPHSLPYGGRSRRWSAIEGVIYM